MNSSTQLQMNNGTQLEVKPVFLLSIKPKQAKIGNLCFDQILLDALDLAFSSMGEFYKQIIYDRLEVQYMVSKEAIPSKLEEFTQALEGLFGLSASMLEINIMAILHQKVPCFKFFPKNGGFSFITYLASLQSYL